MAAVAVSGRTAERLADDDCWPENVPRQDGTIVAVIDWEDACADDPLADLHDLPS
jgi:aminoglycoside phosphotransferase (APT) family kinase protein